MNKLSISCKYVFAVMAITLVGCSLPDPERIKCSDMDPIADTLVGNFNHDYFHPDEVKIADQELYHDGFCTIEYSGCFEVPGMRGAFACSPCPDSWQLQCSVDNSCIDVRSSKKHCGKCNNACSQNKDCNDGQCSCLNHVTAESCAAINQNFDEENCKCIDDLEHCNLTDEICQAQNKVFDKEACLCVEPPLDCPECNPEPDPQSFCTHQEWETGQFRGMTIAKLPGVTYSPENDTQSAVTTFSDTKHGITGLFGVGVDMDSAELLNYFGLKTGSIIENSNYTSSVPGEAWSENGYRGNGEVIYQALPEHEVQRMRYYLNLEGNSLESIVANISSAFGRYVKPTTETHCENDAASLYLARSFYEDDSSSLNIYSIALTCLSTSDKAWRDQDATAIEALNLLDDVISGTLVAPKREAFDSAPMTGYRPYDNVFCQITKLSDTSKAVDFIWVIDNSGSMADELDKLSSSIDVFANRLASSGIDYRVAVTTTDAYAIEEPGVIASQINKKRKYNDFTTYDRETLMPLSNKYYNAMGIRTPVPYINNPGFLSHKNSIINEGGKSDFILAISKDNMCFEENNANVCGIGYEDGFQSGLLALSRLAVDIGADNNDKKYEKSDFNSSQQASYDDIVTLKNHLAKGEFFNYSLNGNVEENKRALTLRYSALKYIIWVSDEESRQFKEQKKLVSTSNNEIMSYIDEKGNGPFYACLTGKKLENGTLSTAEVTPDNLDDVCNPTIHDDLENEIALNIQEVTIDPAKKLLQDLSLDELKKNPKLNNYTQMLEYYLNEYSRFAGSGGIAGFAIVGDIGNLYGGICRNLKVCKGTCYADAMDSIGHNVTAPSGEAGCFNCKAEGASEKNTGWVDSPNAKIGANYGLSYIHLASFLNSYGKDNHSGALGGYASICNSNFDPIMSNIVDDVSGRVASYTLWGYPISSTIRVSIQPDYSSKFIELTRGANHHGFTYVPSQNAIILNGVSDISKSLSNLIISYELWGENKG